MKFCFQILFINHVTLFALVNGSSNCQASPTDSATTTAKKKADREPAQEKEPVSRPRPLSLRSKSHSWGLLKSRNKSYSLGHYSGEKSAQNLDVVLPSEVKMGCSLLDMDTEGQKRDCTVPLCRIQSTPGRPSVFELEKEFLSWNKLHLEHNLTFVLNLFHMTFSCFVFPRWPLTNIWAIAAGDIL